MDKQKIKSVPRLTTDNPVDNFQTALNFTDVSEDGWVWLRQPEMALTEYARQLVKGHGSSIDLGCNDMYVMNKKWDSVTNIAQCTSVYVSPEHEIKAVPTGGGAVYRLGQYETAEIARAVLNDLYIHIATGCTYQMPNDQRARVLVRGMSDERPEKFAGNGKKPVRRGGS